MHKTRWWWLADWALGLSVLVVALATFGGARAKFDGDEAEWIGTAGFFRTLFVEHDLLPEAWPDNHWTRTQPMVARYVIGAWLCFFNDAPTSQIYTLALHHACPPNRR